MSSDLQDLRATLRARAEARTDPEALLASIGPAFRRRRQRRIAAATAGLAAVAVLAAVLAPRLVAGPPATTQPAQPVASTEQSAKAPGGVGSDALTLHFGIGKPPFETSDERWETDTGVERMSVQGRKADGSFAELTLRTDSMTPRADPTASGAVPTLEGVQTRAGTVGGQPATVVTGTMSGLQTTLISWVPGPGVKAELRVQGPVPLDKALAYAGTVRLDQSRPCVFRVRPTVLPPGTSVRSCAIIGTSGAGTITIHGPGGDIGIAVPKPAKFGMDASPGAVAQHLDNGWVYEDLTAGSGGYFSANIRISDPWVEVSAHGQYGMAEVLQVANGLKRT
ncbi:hypothetical protein ACQP00_32900 [Dactylosporangium sp. CS-047395]|uniref:hypothetical protein n=1 Tax=Dactylosporangium sp. CS-047395 TaxID=3239936 RepID=UPI003D8E845F